MMGHVGRCSVLFSSDLAATWEPNGANPLPVLPELYHHPRGFEKIASWAFSQYVQDSILAGNDRHRQCFLRGIFSSVARHCRVPRFSSQPKGKVTQGEIIKLSPLTADSRTSP